MPASFRWQYNGTFDTSSPDFPIRLDADTMVVHAAAGLSLRLLLEFLAQARLVMCTSSCEVLQNHCALAPGPRISMLPHITITARCAATTLSCQPVHLQGGWLCERVHPGQLPWSH